MRSIFFSLIIVAMLLAGCTGGPQEKPSTPQQNSLTQAKTYVDPLPRTALDIIDAEYTEGKLTKKEFIFYSLQAIYEPANLPQQYRGVPLKGFDIADEIMIAYENWDILTPQQQQTITKWIDDPEVNTKQVIDLMGEKRRTARLDGDTVTYTIYRMVAIPGKASVYGLLLQNHSEAEKDALDAKMSLVKKAIVKSWPMYKNLLNIEPKNEVHFFIKALPEGTLGSATIEEVANDPAGRCKLGVDINQTGNDKTTQATVAHELFHCYQYHIPLRAWTEHDQKWLREATATWAENYAYPDYNSEHNRLPAFFESREEELVLRKGLKEYNDYVFFLFLEQKSGAEKVAKVLKDAKTMGTRPALKAIPDFDHKFAEYTVWNWNKDPIRKYTDTPSFPSIPASGSSIVENYLTKDSNYDMEYQMKAGAVSYHTMDIPADVKKIKFTFPSTDDDKNQHWAWVKIGNSWEEQDWTHVGEKTFCLTKPEEKVTQLILVNSNSEIEKRNTTLRASYKLDTSGECPFEISGMTKVTYTFGGSDTSTGSLGTAVGAMSMTGTYISRDVLQYDEEENAYKLKSRTVTCSYTESWDMTDPIQHVVKNVIGSGSTTEEYNTLSTAPTKLRFDDEDGIVTFYLSPEMNDEKWVSYSGNMLIATQYSSVNTPYNQKDNCIIFASISGLAELDKESYLHGNRLYGTKTITTSNAISTVEFDYTLSRN
jgi:hypothetical protein